MKCPKCSQELRTTDLGQYSVVSLDVCPACQGSWFDKGELDRLDRSVWTNVEALTFRRTDAGTQRLSCPKCNHDLEPGSPADAPDLVVDRCMSCQGFWLDAGELEKIEAVALQLDKKLAVTRRIQKPEDWSFLRWLAYCTSRAGRRVTTRK